MSTKKLKREVKLLLKEKPFITKCAASVLGRGYLNTTIQVTIDNNYGEKMSITYRIEKDSSSESGTFIITRRVWGEVLYKVKGA